MENVSVVVITYNEEKNISECLNSLLNLEYNGNYEILVVDASTDNTKNVVKEFKNVKLINSPNKAFGIQRNLGIKNSKYDLVAFTDADCIVPKDWLNNMIKELEENDCLGGSVRNPENTTLIGKGISCLGFPAGGILGIEFSGNLCTCNSIFRKKIFEKVGYFNENLLYGGEDTDLVERMNKGNVKIKLSNNCFVYHKNRNLREFIGWNIRRGKARYYLFKNPLHLFTPLGVFIYPLTRRFRLLIKKRKQIDISLFNLFTTVIFLFFLRQSFMAIGWFYGAGQSFTGKKKH